MSIQRPQVIFDQNDNLLRVIGLKNKSTGSFINAGVTATADLVPEGTTSVITGSAISLSYVAASDGNWEGTYPDTLALTVGAALTARITVNAGAGLQGYWELPVDVRTRTA